MKLHLSFLAATFALLQAGAADTPQSAFNRLIEADRGFSAAGSGKSAVDAVLEMFADDVTVPGPKFAFVQGKDKALEVLKANPDNVTGKLEWAPIRGGISADGLHGFTFGYMTMQKTGRYRTPTEVPGLLDQGRAWLAGRRVSTPSASGRARVDHDDAAGACRHVWCRRRHDCAEIACTREPLGSRAGVLGRSAEDRPRPRSRSTAAPTRSTWAARRTPGSSSAREHRPHVGEGHPSRQQPSRVGRRITCWSPRAAISASPSD